MRRRHVNSFLRTSFGGGRVAGHGMSYAPYDSYSEESFPDIQHGQHSVRVKLPSDSMSEKQLESLSGEVITYTIDD